MTATAKLFMHGRSQAVRLPKEFRMPGTEVKVRKIGDAVLLEPITPERKSVDWALIDSLSNEPLFPNGREQPPMPPDDDLPSFD